MKDNTDIKPETTKKLAWQSPEIISLQTNEAEGKPGTNFAEAGTIYAPS